MPKFEKGHSGGLRKGIPNKRTEQWEVFADYCMNGGLERFERELNTLEGKDFVNSFLSLLEYHKPKLARTDVTHDVKDEAVKQFIIKGAAGHNSK